MRRIFCDVCGKEITGKTKKTIDIPCHLWSLKNRPGYVDEDRMPISGRYDSIDACSECWNRGYNALITAINNLMEKHKIGN